MSSLKQFQCEICRIVSENPIHWFVIECSDQKLSVIKWDLTAAASPSARHFCGEAHAQTYISRWFECVLPPRQVLNAIKPKGHCKNSSEVRRPEAFTAC